MNETAQALEKFSSEVLAPVLYDADAPQKIALEIDDDEAKYEIVQHYRGLPDDVLVEYDRLREVVLETTGDTTDLNNNSTAADEYCFNELCVDVDGFEGEKPENWKEMIPYDEKKFGIGKLLGVKIVSNDAEKQVKKRQWGTPSSANTVEIMARFNDTAILTLRAHFGSQTPADIAAYNVIKNRISLIERGLDQQSIKIPASIGRKAELFDKINPRVEGYSGRVPIHHKAAFITGFFESKISSAEKK